MRVKDGIRRKVEVGMAAGGGGGGLGGGGIRRVVRMSLVLASLVPKSVNASSRFSETPPASKSDSLFTKFLQQGLCLEMW